MTVCIGLDAHATSITFQAKDEAGRVVARETLASSRESLAFLAARFPGGTVVLEASSVSLWMHDELTAQGMDVVVAHPVNIRRVLGKKNDEVDAGFLVDAHRLGVLPRSYIPPPKFRTLRELVRRRAFTTQEQTRVKNRIHAILLRRGEKKRVSFAIRDRARLALEDAEVPSLLRFLETIERETRALDDEIERVAESHEETRNLMTVPGFGALTALALFAEAGEIERFPTANRFAAYVGLVPQESQSGERLHRGHITRRGNPNLQRLLNQAAWAHVTHAKNSEIAAAYRRIAKKKGKKVAIVAASRRLAVLAYVLLRENRPYTINGRASTVACE